jgi:hypothetical protein
MDQDQPQSAAKAQVAFEESLEFSIIGDTSARSIETAFQQPEDIIRYYGGIDVNSKDGLQQWQKRVLNRITRSRTRPGY